MYHTCSFIHSYNCMLGEIVSDFVRCFASKELQNRDLSGVQQSFALGFVDEILDHGVVTSGRCCWHLSRGHLGLCLPFDHRVTEVVIACGQNAQNVFLSIVDLCIAVQRCDFNILLFNGARQNENLKDSNWNSIS